jgi:class 3 adenylate cyclase/tetratricopeptide (TPR) repeat protein
MRFCGNCGMRLSLDTAIIQPASSSADHLSDRIGVMMGADLAERFREAGVQAAGQRRNVTILFVDLAGFTEFANESDNEETYQLVRQFISLMVKDVYKYDGMVDKLLGDGLMAIFGAPIAHENNADLAMRAAIDMQADAYQLTREVKAKLGKEVGLHIGLHSGPVVVGSLGTDLLMNYTAIGDTVNLAFRLQQSAEPGAILVSQSVYQQTRHMLDYTPTAPLVLKGISDPVQGYLAGHLKDKPGPSRGIEGLRAPLIGRTSELDRLHIAQQVLITSREGRFFIVQGEAGVGKTRLITEFSYELEQTGVHCIIGHNYIYRRSVSYWLFMDLLYNYLAMPASTPEATLRARLSDKVDLLLGQQTSECLPYLEYILSLKPASAEVAERMSLLDAAQLRQQVFMAMRDLLVAEARRNPLVLVFEDLQWADEASLELLRFLFEAVRQEPLIIIALSRPSSEPAHRRLVEHADRALGGRFSMIVLETLSPRQAERLFHELLDCPELPEELSVRILSYAAGNPFYLEETIRMLIDDKVIYRDGSRWFVSSKADIHTLGVPSTLQGVILARYDRLTELHRRTLQVDSVIGRDFPSRLLIEALGQEGSDSIHQALQELAERGFLQRFSEISENDYRFTHALVSDAIYSTLLKADRAELHGQVAEAIEKLYSSRLDDQVELLARHYSWSNRYDRAVHFLTLAGQKAARGYANEQARQHFDLALDLIKRVSAELDTFLQVYTGRGDVLTRMGDYPTARASYFSAMRALDCMPGADVRQYVQTRSQLLRKVSVIHERQGDYAQALSSLAEAQAALDEMPDPPEVERAWILNDTGWIYFRRGDLDAADQALQHALHLVEDGTHYDLIASIYNRLGGIYYQKDQLDQAAGFVRKSLFLRQEIGDVNAVARSYNNLGLLRWKRGDWDSALDNFMRSLKLHANLGDVEGTIELHTNLGLLHLDRGNFDEAQRHLETGLAAASQIGHSYHIGLLFLHFSRLFVAREDWGHALEFCQKGLETFGEIGVTEYLVDLNTYMGLAWLGIGDLSQAETCGQTALSLFRQLSAGKEPVPAEDHGRALRLIGQVDLIKKDFPAADQAFQESEAIFKAVGNQMEQARTASARAELSLLQGDGISARLFLNQARQIFRQLGARIDLHRVEAMAIATPRIDPAPTDS